MRTQRCARCNKRLKGPYHHWSFTTGAPRAVCKKCKEIHQSVNRGDSYDRSRNSHDS
nr:MAG TPA: Cleavage inducing molecular chaperone [Caudoviricetes sp.]DAS46028.1 MAG TPA: Cleavage inducing molecular chaperone [Caudoviricetes sp.]